MIDRSKIRVSRLTLGLLAALAAAPAFAQSTSASLGGRVVADDGQPVANAEVVIVHTPSGTVSRTTTDASGRYVSRGLRVGGPYTVTVQAPGFQSVAQEDIYAQLAETSQVNVALMTDTTATLEAVTVVGTRVSDIFSPDRTGTGTAVNRETIDQLPSVGRNIQDFIRLDPRIAQTDRDRTEISAGGQNIRFNNIRIDGVTVNDGFGLEGNNLTTARQPISLDAIEDINISLANYDVSLSGYTGANVDAVTKSGTNEFSGSVYGLYRDGDWGRQQVEGSVFAPPKNERTYGATFSGPLIKDRLFFFLAYEQFDRTIGAPANLPGAIDQSQIDAVRNVASQRWGFDAGDFSLPGELKFEVEDIVAKIDWNISDDHRAYFRYNRSRQDEPFLRQIGPRNLSLSSFWHVNAKEFESGVFQLFSDWSDVFSTDFKIGRSESSSLWDLNAALPQIRLCWGASANQQTCAGSDSIYLGAEQFRHVNILETQIDTAYGAGFLFLGDHEVKFGAEYKRDRALNLFGRDQFGVYNFGGATFEQALARFQNGTPSRYSARFPIDGDINSIAAQIELETLSFFLQDTWRPTYNLTLTGGLRYDRPRVPNAPPANPAASAIFGFDNTNTIDGNGLLQPRFGFNYTFDTERPTQLRGGVGLFSGAAANVWLANPYQNNGGVTLGEIFVGNGAGIVFTPDPNNQPGTEPGGAAGPGGPLDLVDGDLRQPAVWKANLAIDHELPMWGVVASAEVLLTRVKEALYYENLNLGSPSLQSQQDGRLFYWSNPFTGTGDRGNRNRDFTDVTVLRPTSKGGGQQMTLSLSKPTVDHWSWSLGYTHTNAKEVSPLTSSQAISNWANSFRLNPNDPVSATSVYEIRDRFIGTLGYERNFFGDNKTSFGLFWEGRSGRPYSWSFINDANGDGRVNDLFYVPAGPGDVLFTGGAAMEQAFFDYVSRNPGLAAYQGRVVDPGSERSPWVNIFDVRITQELPGFFSGHKSEIWLDIMNVGNLINRDWGRIEEVGFPFGLGVASFAGIDEATGRYIYNFNENNIRDLALSDNLRGASRWAAQVGFRYRF